MAIGLSLMLVTGMQLLNRHLDVIMLGAISGSRPAGIYRVANRCSQLMLIFFAAANQVLAPFISRLFVKNKFCKLQKIISLSALGVFCVSVVIWMFFLFFGLPLLGIFGSEFTNGYFALITLSTSFLVCTVASAAGLLLMMTDFEKEAAWSVIASAVVNVFLNALLIPAYSYNGAAIATAVSTLVMNLLMVIFTIKRLKINPTFFGLLRFRRGNDER
jgi:O-antigen/teichoic acid export membrane protein